ncbi:hypothetical protein BDA96_02G090800 [Sorghum bicolor]|uniref:Uncharacterized protein n=1 Tax=Sorghum bicolor TaxID=4558 RepID=A0A921URV7_SORBI|nr:hypothetical protein BDA96_02G090800 [Sorghum bicolor]
MSFPCLNSIWVSNQLATGFVHTRGCGGGSAVAGGSAEDGGGGAEEAREREAERGGGTARWLQGRAHDRAGRGGGGRGRGRVQLRPHRGSPPRPRKGRWPARGPRRRRDRDIPAGPGVPRQRRHGGRAGRCRRRQGRARAVLLRRAPLRADGGAGEPVTVAGRQQDPLGRLQRHVRLPRALASRRRRHAGWRGGGDLLVRVRREEYER